MKRDLRYYLNRLTRFGIGGATTIAVNIGVTVILVEGFRVGPSIAFGVALACAWGVNFILQRYFVFTAAAGPLLPQLVGFLAATAGVRITEYLAFLALVHGMNWHYLLTIGLILTASFLIKFVFFDRLVFKRR